METRDPSQIKQQLVEMESFFTGDFTIRKKCTPIGEQEGGLGAEIESDSLEQVAAEVNVCRKCEIGITRTNAVPGEGHPKARLVFVGEAPGADEDAQGRPFVGRAGQLLTRMVESMGLKREEVYIGNTLKCRPPGNRDPKTEEIENCNPFLRRQLALLEPEVIVALGRPAAQTLLETTRPIGQLRGQFHEYYYSDSKPPAKVMPTYHPAYLLRNYTKEARGKVWDDLQKVMKELGLPLKG